VKLREELFDRHTQCPQLAFCDTLTQNAKSSFIFWHNFDAAPGNPEGTSVKFDGKRLILLLLLLLLLLLGRLSGFF
jgi:hypothetical protein